MRRFPPEEVKEISDLVFTAPTHAPQAFDFPSPDLSGSVAQVGFLDATAFVYSFKSLFPVDRTCSETSIVLGKDECLKSRARTPNEYASFQGSGEIKKIRA